MANFVVPVQGKLVVRAEDKDAARTIVNGILADRQPWLEVPQYAGIERIAEINEVSREPVVFD